MKRIAQVRPSPLDRFTTGSQLSFRRELHELISLLSKELAYSLLRTLRTSTIAAVVDRLTPLLHMDPVVKLPPEITAEIFSYLDPASLLTASLASKTWRSRILDTRLWRQIFLSEGWGVDMTRARNFERRAALIQSRKLRMRSSDADKRQRKAKKRVPPGGIGAGIASHFEELSTADAGHLALGRHDAEGDHEMYDASDGLSLGSSPAGSTASANQSVDTSNWIKPTMITKDANSTPKLNWTFLYKQRRRLEENWSKGRFKNFQLPHPLYPNEGHQECVYAIQFSGQWLVSSSRDRTLRVWNLETRRLRGPPLIGHTKSVLCLQFDPSEEEDIIMSGSSDRSVIIWRFSTGEKLHQLLEAHQDSVLNLRFDKRYLVTCSKDKLIKVWTRNELLPTDENYPGIYKGAGVRYPSYIVDTSLIPSAVLESQIASRQIRTLPPYTLLMTLDGHGAAVNAIQIGEKEIISASGDRLIKVWELHNGRCRKTLVGHSKGIACVQYDSRRIVSGSNDDTVRIYDHVSGAEVACLQGHHDLVRTVQAAFGDLPGAEEAMKLEAMAADQDYWESRKRHDIDSDLLQGHRRRSSRDTQASGSDLSKDIKALGAQLPPGGGGSKWARIVSGSYDETIIIWTKDNKGGWVVGQRLRQEEAAAAASAAQDIEELERLQATLNTRPLSGSWHPNSPASFQQSSMLQHLQNHPPISGQWAPNATAGPSQQHQQTHHPNPNTQTQPLNIPQHVGTQNAATHNGILGAGHPPPITHAAIAAALGQGQHQHMPMGPIPAHIRMQHAGQPTARVFKLQFDARKLICASQDTRIVGWDFACGDEEIEAASQFFTGGGV